MQSKRSVCYTAAPANWYVRTAESVLAAVKTAMNTYGTSSITTVGHSLGSPSPFPLSGFTEHDRITGAALSQIEAVYLSQVSGQRHAHQRQTIAMLSSLSGGTTGACRPTHHLALPSIGWKKAPQNQAYSLQLHRYAPTVTVQVSAVPVGLFHTAPPPLP